VETPAFAAMLRRMLRAYRKRVEIGDVDALPDMAAMAKDVDDMIYDAANGCHDRGYSWTDIANQLGVSRQAALKRFTRKRI
jgi:hypothetical protein